MKIPGSLILLLSYSLISMGQMKVNGELADIRHATKQNVLVAIAGEYSKDYGDEEYSIKIDKSGKFKMYYSRTIKSKSYNQGDGGWTLTLNGSVTLHDADVTEKEYQKDKYGDVINTIVYYTKFYVVFQGTDNKGKNHSFCATIYQKFDNKYILSVT